MNVKCTRPSKDNALSMFDAIAPFLYCFVDLTSVKCNGKINISSFSCFSLCLQTRRFTSDTCGTHGTTVSQFNWFGSKGVDTECSGGSTNTTEYQSKLFGCAKPISSRYVVVFYYLLPTVIINSYI